MIEVAYLEEGTRKRKVKETNDGNTILVSEVEFQRLVDHIKVSKKDAHNYFNYLVSQETVTTETRDIWVVHEDFDLIHMEIENFMWEFDQVKLGVEDCE
ncbi:hypothetical protein [Staphylococcus xylosus]|uniref:hypothetical protein n=1 Tax=Staphylococcus xylosus TaxID=1288 RepID=UPI003F555375